MTAKRSALDKGAAGLLGAGLPIYAPATAHFNPYLVQQIPAAFLPAVSYSRKYFDHL